MTDFIINSVLLGTGLAMDAFSVSVADAISEPCMKRRKMVYIPLLFAAFQALMPIIGWFCIHSLVGYFSFIERFIPFISFGLLALIGGNMIREGITCNEEEGCVGKLSIGVLLAQGVATSIDALSVGFKLSEYDALRALASAAIIAAVTFLICLAGIVIGKKVGDKFSSKAQVLGGGILVLMAVKFLIEGLI
ncbi:MAG: manganese efflux pump [Clostridia bacterium]|nr:manganese efflux pump [Clostridia bacterium]